MTVSQVLELARQRQEEQARQEQQAEQAKAAKDRSNYVALVTEIHSGKEVAPEKVLDRLEKCGETAEQLAEDLEALAERESTLAWLQENPETESLKTINERIEDAKAACVSANEQYARLSRDYPHHRRLLEIRQQERRSKWYRIRAIEEQLDLDPSDYQESEG